MAPVQVEKRTITPRIQTQRREKPMTREENMIEALSPIIRVMVKAVRKAGRRMIRDFGEISSLQVSQKGPGDFVSNADMLAEKTLIQELSADRPDFGFITEEEGEIKSKNNSAMNWVIDPIDGTTNFLHAIPCFAISVGLMKNNEVIAGVTYNPITNDLFYAEKGRGSYLMTPTGNVRLRVSGRNKIEHALIGSNGYNSKENHKTIEKVIDKVSSIRYNGSTTLSLAMVAAGQLDGYIANRFKLWDIAVGYLLIKEAGGFVSDFSADRDINRVLEKQQVIASNVALKDTFLKLIGG